MPMGPIELADVVGLDVVMHVGEIITRELGRDLPPFAQRLRELVAARKLGRKSGQGFYAWRDGKAVRASATAAPPAGPRRPPDPRPASTSARPACANGSSPMPTWSTPA